jgi:hypothetical protein
LAVPLAFALGDWLWRSGLAAAWDELSVHTLLQQAREGLALPLGFGRGELHLRWISWGLDPRRRRAAARIYGPGAEAGRDCLDVECQGGDQ